MTASYEFRQGDSPLLISVPHDGRALPPDIGQSMSKAGRSIPDTDWHVRRLYDLAQAAGSSILSANYSRYVVDLNRSSADEKLYADQPSTGLCPTQTFAGEDIYLPGILVDAAEKRRRIQRYWQPYHDRMKACLAELRERHGYALLWDAHSIRGVVPTLFDGELPDLNIGTNDGSSCVPEVEDALMRVVGRCRYSGVVNGRFKGGFITRHYGAPANGVIAVQLELAQRCYMDEDTSRYAATAARDLASVIGEMLQAFLSVAVERFSCASGHCH